MAIKFKNALTYGFGFNITALGPVDSRTVVENIADLTTVWGADAPAYVGLVVSVVEDGNLYILTAEDATVAENWKVVGSGAGSMSVENFTVTDGKVAEAENIGQIIYVTTGDETYPAGPYIVTGVGAVAKLGTTTATGDIAGDVETLKGDVSTLKADLEAVEESVADVYTKTDADATFVAKEGYVAFTQEEKDLLATVQENADANVIETVKVNGKALTPDSNLAVNIDLTNYVVKVDGKDLSTNDYTDEDKAAANYITSVGDNLSVEDGVLSVSIPEVSVPFQSIATDDKVLTLTEGVLSSTLSYTRETVNGEDSLVLKGKDDVVIGSVPVADFIADGMLQSVEPIEGTSKFKFVFNTDKDGDASDDSFEVDFSKYVDTYHADEATLTLDSSSNTFSVTDGVFVKSVDFETYKTEATTALSTGLAAKVDTTTYASKVNELTAKFDDYYTKGEIDSEFAPKEAQENVIEVVKVNGKELEVSEKSVNIDLSAYALAADLSGYVAVEDGKRLMTEEEGTKLEEIAAGAEVNFIKSTTEDFTVTEGELALTNSYVVAVDGKGLSTEDFTAELKNKLVDIAEGAEVNVVKSVDITGALNLSEAGELSIDLSVYATTEDLNNGLVAKLTKDATVNGQAFDENGAVTINGTHIAVGAAITRGDGDSAEEVYSAGSSIQAVLDSLSARIDVLDPNVSGEYGVSSITAGSGIEVSGASSTPTIAVKVSSVEGNMAEVKTDGIYVSGPTWQTI